MASANPLCASNVPFESFLRASDRQYRFHTAKTQPGHLLTGQRSATVRGTCNEMTMGRLAVSTERAARKEGPGYRMPGRGANFTDPKPDGGRNRI